MPAGRPRHKLLCRACVPAYLPLLGYDELSVSNEVVVHQRSSASAPVCSPASVHAVGWLMQYGISTWNQHLTMHECVQHLDCAF